MPSAQHLDVERLIAPIPGDDPAGVAVSFVVRQQLDEARKSVDPASFAPDDPLRPEQFQPADWRGIIGRATDLLGASSKDLLLAARLLEAMLKVHGFGGLRDGLLLLRRLISECWDRLNPPIEDGDLDVRAGPFNWLDDADRGARFPNSVRAAPIVVADGVEFGWIDWRKAQDAKDAEKSAAFERALQAMPRPACQDAVDNLDAALNELTVLTRDLTAKMGDSAPGLVQLRQALADCRTLAGMVLARKGPAPVAATAAEPAEPAAAGADAVAPAANGRAAPKAITTREDVYEQLATAANVLMQIEPHSPIPYLIRRAVELGKLPFPLLMKELVRDPNIITEMNRELGITDGAGG
jgi:type VI secretion system protein ImpA